MADMAEDLKAKPNQYAFCSGGLYGGTHLPAEVLLQAIGTKARHVPHKGGGPCLAAVVGEHVHFSTQWAGTSIPLAEGKKIRILAVQGDERMKSIPDVPTIKEGGVDAEWVQWLGISIPKKTPAPLAAQIKAMVKKVAQDPAFNTSIGEPGGRSALSEQRGGGEIHQRGIGRGGENLHVAPGGGEKQEMKPRTKKDRALLPGPGLLVMLGKAISSPVQPVQPVWPVRPV